MDKKEKKGLAIGAVIGAVAGVITGILFAPKSGKETRADIKDGAEKVIDKAHAEAQKIQTEVTELVTKTETKLKTLSGKAGDTAKEHIKTAKHTASNLANVAKAFKAGQATDKDLNEAINKAKDVQKALKSYLQK